MFEKITPEQAGISSNAILRFIESTEACGARTHGFLFMKGDKLFAEGYYKPFHETFCHRMYSETKSFVGVAVGLLEEEGKLSLNDKIVDYFSDKIDAALPKYLSEQTVEEMLKMTTVGEPSWWFASGDPDRVHQYFNEPRKTRPSGTLWEYDSPASQVLCELAERLSGKPLLEYLKEKLFNEMGTFRNARMLKTPSGASWGDSAMICTLRDMASFGRFVMNYGTWNGKRLMNEEYLRKATSKMVDNKENEYGSAYGIYGYGYQIWHIDGDGFAFVGMGDQLTVCYPKQDLLFACMSDNQGTSLARNKIFSLLTEYILPNLSKEPLPQNRESQLKLTKKINDLELFRVNGLPDSPLREKLNGSEYLCNENPMGISKFSFVFFDEESGEFRYTNKQGEKTIPFGVNRNVFGRFPQYGYSKEYGAMKTTDGHMYKDAVSFAWLQENKISLCVQIIDDYFGNMNAIFAFNGDVASANFTSTAENFLFEYRGKLVAKRSN